MSDILTEKGILTTNTKAAHFIDHEIITECIEADETLPALDTCVDPNDAKLFPVEYLNTLNPPELAPFHLMLEPDMPVKLLHNLQPKLGFCKGAKIVIRDINTYSLRAEVGMGPFAGGKMPFPRIPITTAEDSTSPVRFSRRQFPVRPSYSMTIKEAQGQPLVRVGLFLKSQVYTHGQIYAALTRCSDLNQLEIISD